MVVNEDIYSDLQLMFEPNSKYTEKGIKDFLNKFLVEKSELQTILKKENMEQNGYAKSDFYIALEKALK